jgi:hypothetical protein
MQLQIHVLYLFILQDHDTKLCRWMVSSWVALHAGQRFEKL